MNSDSSVLSPSLGRLDLVKEMGGQSEDKLEMVDEGRRDVRGSKLIVELAEDRLTVPVGGRSLESVVNGVAVKAVERTVPK